MNDPRIEQLRAARRLLAVKEAKDDLLKFMRLRMPDPEDPDDVLRSRYDVTPQARLLCDIIQKIERGELKRVAVSIGPQFGKSDILSRAGPAWISGRNPYANMILGSYNQDFANEFGGDVRGIMEAPFYAQVFPNHGLQKGGQAKDLLITREGAKMAFVGVGGSGSGKPADYFFVDDPYRNDEDAQSETYRERVWSWFNGVVLARAKKHTAVLIVHTRWNADDLIGRLCDPDHPERNKKYSGISQRWTYINLEAVIHDPKLAAELGLELEVPTDPLVIQQFGQKPVVALWENQKPLELMAEAKQANSRLFNALYMGRPTPDDGDYFKADWLVEYNREELPANLRLYGASDHAATDKARNDPNVMGLVGVDEDDTLWVLPDLVWDQMETDRVVEELLVLFRRRPLLWWMESENISKSFGPFLRKRMIETKTYVTIDDVNVSKDKVMRARSLQGRMAMRKVRFPRFAPWWMRARQEMLKFPFGAHDDFVDFLSLIANGMMKQSRPKAEATSNDNVVQTGSIEWILRKAKLKAQRDKADKAVAGW